MPSIGFSLYLLVLQWYQAFLYIFRIKVYKIRIYYDNISSQKLFEKIGAVKVGEEEGEMAKFMREAKEVLSGKALDDFSCVYKELTEAEPNVIYVYELTADKI